MDSEKARSEVRPLPAAPATQHEIERMHARFRENESAINGVRVRVEAVENRTYNLEAGLISNTTKLATIEGKMGVIDTHINMLQNGQDSLTEMVRAQTNILVKHTTEEAHQQQRQYEAIQKLSRNILLGVTFLGALTITLVALYELFGGEGQLLISLSKLFGAT